MTCSDRKSRGELLSTAEVQWSTTKSDGMWRRGLRQPTTTDVQAAGRALDERVMRPLRSLLGHTRHLLLSSDGALNLVPFGALVDEQQRYLVETYTITYLTS